MDNRKHNNILISTAGKFLCIVLLSFGLVFGAFYADVTAAIETSFLYTLSNFSGTLPYYWGRISADKERNEIYVLYKNSISVFNPSGMEIYRFGEDVDLGRMTDIDVDQAGDILLLTYRESGYEVIRCNFRGEPVGRIDILNLPDEFSGFSPTRITCRDDNIYLASMQEMKIIVIASDGQFETGYDIASLIELSDKERKGKEMGGFSVNDDGDILFTIPVLFKAYKLSPDRKIAGFGRAGGAPGNFGIVTGIVSDSRGNIIITDRLKNSVIIFDKNYNFLKEFGYYGYKPGNLVLPADLTLDRQNRIYVTQGAGRGISVFQITYP